MYALIGISLIVAGIITAIVAAQLFLRPKGPSAVIKSADDTPAANLPAIRPHINDSRHAFSVQFLNNGVQCFRQNDLLGAINNLSRSITLNSDNGQGHEYISFVYALSGHYYLARKHAEIALQHNFKYFAHIANAIFYRHKLDFKKSLLEAQHAIRVNGKLYHGHYWSGVAHADLGQFKQALADCESVSRHDEDAANLLYEYIQEAMSSSRKPSSRFIETGSQFDESSARERSPYDKIITAEEVTGYRGDENGESFVQGGSYKSDRRDDLNESIDSISANETTVPTPEHYAQLGLSTAASLQEIKETFRKLVKVWHPDRFAHDPSLQEFAQVRLSTIHEAYKLLTFNLQQQQ